MESKEMQLGITRLSPDNKDRKACDNATQKSDVREDSFPATDPKHQTDRQAKGLDVSHAPGMQQTAV